MLLRPQASQLCFRRPSSWLTCELSSICWFVSLRVGVFSSSSFMFLRHQREADVVHQSSGAALDGSLKSLALVQTLMNKEKKVKEVAGGLRSR